MHALSLATLTILSLAQLVTASPAPQIRPGSGTYGSCDSGIGICIVYSLSAYGETATCLKKNVDPATTTRLKSCHPRLQYCILNACGLPRATERSCPDLSYWTDAQIDACVAKLYSNLTPTSPVVKCVVGSVGNCPLYQWS